MPCWRIVCIIICVDDVAGWGAFHQRSMVGTHSQWQSCIYPPGSSIPLPCSKAKCKQETQQFPDSFSSLYVSQLVRGSSDYHFLLDPVIRLYEAAGSKGHYAPLGQPDPCWDSTFDGWQRWEHNEELCYVAAMGTAAAFWKMRKRSTDIGLRVIRVSRQTENEWDCSLYSSGWCIAISRVDFLQRRFSRPLGVAIFIISNSIIFIKINLSWERQAAFRQYSKFL